MALFAGAGGGILGGHLLGWRTVCAVERDAYAAAVLAQRQADRCIEAFPIWSSVETFDGRPWRGRVDVISGGFPCQDISAAGKGAGIDGERSGMWKHMARIINEVRPRKGVFIENSPMLAVGRGLGTVLCDLAEMGFDARWGVVGAHHVAAPHKRERIWIVAASTKFQRNGGNDHTGISTQSGPAGEPGDGCGAEDLANSVLSRLQGRIQNRVFDKKGRKKQGKRPSVQCRFGRQGNRDLKQWATEPKLGRVAHGVAHRLDRLKCIGNGQVPHCAALAWRLLTEDIS